MNSRQQERNQATKNWQKANPTKAKYSQYKSYTKRYILKQAPLSDIPKMRQQVEQRIKEEKEK